MQQTILKFLLLCRTDTAQHVSGITMPHIRSPSNCRCSLWLPYECGGGSVLSRGRFVSGIFDIQLAVPPSHTIVAICHNKSSKIWAIFVFL